MSVAIRSESRRGAIQTRLPCVFGRLIGTNRIYNPLLSADNQHFSVVL
mgnify:CR=1 FL=1